MSELSGHGDGSDASAQEQLELQRQAEQEQAAREQLEAQERQAEAEAAAPPPEVESEDDAADEAPPGVVEEPEAETEAEDQTPPDEVELDDASESGATIYTRTERDDGAEAPARAKVEDEDRTAENDGHAEDDDTQAGDDDEEEKDRRGDRPDDRQGRTGEDEEDEDGDGGEQPGDRGRDGDDDTGDGGENVGGERFHTSREDDVRRAEELLRESQEEVEHLETQYRLATALGMDDEFIGYLSADIDDARESVETASKVLDCARSDTINEHGQMDYKGIIRFDIDHNAYLAYEDQAHGRYEEVTHISYTHVPPDMRGNGLSDRLREGLIERCKARGIEYITSVPTQAATVRSMATVFGEDNVVITDRDGSNTFTADEAVRMANEGDDISFMRITAHITS